MAAESFRLRIVTPQGVSLDEPGVSSLTAWGAEGKFEILPGHGRFVTPVRIGELRFRRGSGRHLSEKIWVLEGGMLEVSREGVTVITPTAEAAAGIDPDKTHREKEQAQQVLAALQKGEGKGSAQDRARWRLKYIELLVTAWKEAARQEEGGLGR